jgi:hypothetical protein
MPVFSCPSRGGNGAETVGDGAGNDRIFTNIPNSNGTLPTALGFAAHYLLTGGQTKVMVTDYATNQAVTPDHGIAGTQSQSQILTKIAKAGDIDQNWPRNRGYQRYSTYDVSRPVRTSDIVDGLSYTLLVGEISMDTRMYNSGCLSYRDAAFAGARVLKHGHEERFARE